MLGGKKLSPLCVITKKKKKKKVIKYTALFVGGIVIKSGGTDPRHLPLDSASARYVLTLLGLETVPALVYLVETRFPGDWQLLQQTA